VTPPAARRGLARLPALGGHGPEPRRSTSAWPSPRSPDGGRPRPSGEPAGRGTSSSMTRASSGPTPSRSTGPRPRCGHGSPSSGRGAVASTATTGWKTCSAATSTARGGSSRSSRSRSRSAPTWRASQDRSWSSRCRAPPCGLARAPALRRALGVATRPAAAFLLWTAVMVGWHVPGAYELALEQRWAHDLEHASMVLAGLLAWVSVMAAAPRRRMRPRTARQLRGRVVRRRAHPLAGAAPVRPALRRLRRAAAPPARPHARLPTKRALRC
jgi:hypothetical protein